MANVEVEHLSFAYPGSDRLILEDICMDVPEGEFVCLLGQSGCGKSTFLRLLDGLEKPTSGTMKIDGAPIEGPSLDRSMVFQDYGLFPWMSAGENIVLALRQRFPEKKKAECRDIARNALKTVGLPPAAFDKYPKELSGGMKQRCALARSFSMNPSMLLMDEPFGALDAVTRAKLQDTVIDLWSHRKPHKTVFFVTHDVEEALLLATRIYVFGQSPSNIVFQRDIPLETKPGRHEMYESPQIIQLRNELVECINRDVMSHVEED